EDGPSTLRRKPVASRAGILLEQTDGQQGGHVAVGRARAHAEARRDIGHGQGASVFGEGREHQQPEQQGARQPRALREGLVAGGERVVFGQPAQQAGDTAAASRFAYDSVDLWACQLDGNVAASHSYAPRGRNRSFTSPCDSGKWKVHYLTFETRLRRAAVP